MGILAYRTVRSRTEGPARHQTVQWRWCRGRGTRCSWHPLCLRHCTWNTPRKTPQVTSRLFSFRSSPNSWKKSEKGKSNRENNKKNNNSINKKKLHASVTKNKFAATLSFKHRHTHTHTHTHNYFLGVLFVCFYYDFTPEVWWNQKIHPRLLTSIQWWKRSGCIARTKWPDWICICPSSLTSATHKHTGHHAAAVQSFVAGYVFALLHWHLQHINTLVIMLQLSHHLSLEKKVSQSDRENGETK